MFFNRFRSALPAQPVADPTPSPQAFLLCPLVWLPLGSPAHGQFQRELYELALARAKEVVRPSILERDLLAAWN
jgi:hypothetical protein